MLSFRLRLFVGLKRLATAMLLCACVRGETPPPWTLVQNEHFEIYSQAGDQPARSTLIWFEQLHKFFSQSGIDLEAELPVRIIGFRSEKEYDAHRLRPASDAYYVGTETRDYIVLPALGGDVMRVAAHEYAHLVLHAAELHFPPWLAEGLAEFFSTIRIGEHGCELGSDLPTHSSVLNRRPWIPLSTLLALPEGSSSRADREYAELFYAESWKLTQMLVLSAEYRSGFHQLATEMVSGIPSANALTTVYNKSLDTILRDLHAWANTRDLKPLTLPGVTAGEISVKVSPLSSFACRSMLADLLFASGKLDEAEARYSELAQEAPQNPNILAALGALALSKGDRESARQRLNRAIQLGTDDARLCYRYALLADQMGLNGDDIQAALERAVALRPGFDDARYKLALLENNGGHFEAALDQFRQMRSLPSARAYGYWSAVAYALDEVGKHEEAKAAARHAAEHATTPDERARAAQLEYMAQTEVRVGFAHDASGRAQLVTTRVPRGTSDWNPFIEPGDHIRRADGQLESIQCKDNSVTGVSIHTQSQVLRLSIPDPFHVQMRNAPPQFTCGPQTPVSVSVEFAIVEKQGTDVDGTLRGMEFGKDERTPDR